MAAADLSRSRAAASRSTKGLFFICTLLCLLCFVSSSVDKEKYKENYLTFKQELDELKEKHTTDSAMTSEQISEYLTLMDQLTALVKKAKKFAPDDLSSVEKRMKSITAVIKKTKARLDRDNEELNQQMQNTEEELAKIQELIPFLQEQQAEL